MYVLCVVRCGGAWSVELLWRVGHHRNVHARLSTHWSRQTSVSYVSHGGSTDNRTYVYLKECDFYLPTVRDSGTMHSYEYVSNCTNHSNVQLQQGPRWALGRRDTAHWTLGLIGIANEYMY